MFSQPEEFTSVGAVASSVIFEPLAGTKSETRLVSIPVDSNQEVSETRMALPSSARAKASLISFRGNVWEMICSKG